MAKKVFNVSLSASSFRDLQKNLEKYKSDLQLKMNRLLERLAEEGVEIARMEITTLDAIFSGELIESIHSEEKKSQKDKVIFAVVAGTDHVFFVEFGTGQRGMESPYPYEFPNGVTWEYNVGETIRYNELTGRYYWFYPGDDGKWHYTEGMPSRPFMYNTAMQLYKKVDEVAKEVFG